MTLVISLLTHDGVYQVSDRRLVRLAGSSVVPFDDDRNKAVLFRDRIAFAYTGLAELDKDERRTDQWLAKTLAAFEAEQRGDQSDALRFIADAATEEFERPLLYRLPPHHRFHAFVGVGWARFRTPEDPEADFSPYLACVSNYHDAEGRELDAPRRDFDFWVRALQPDERGLVLAIGQPADPDGLARRIASVDGAANAPDLFVDLLAGEVRRVAETNPAVGRGLLINMLPRGSIKPDSNGSVWLLSGPDPEHQTFLYVPADDDQAEMYGPTVVSGGTILSGFTAAPL